MSNSKSMKEGTCIKCGSNEVHVSEDFWGQQGSLKSNTIPVTILANAVLKNYVCTNCGYLESYIKEDSKLNKIKDKWPKA